MNVIDATSERCWEGMTRRSELVVCLQPSGPFCAVVLDHTEYMCIIPCSVILKDVRVYTLSTLPIDCSLQST